MGRGPESSERRRRIVHVRSRTLGPDDPTTLSSLENLANTLQRIGALNEAKVICEDLLTTRIRVLPADHLDIARTRELLRAIDQDLGTDP
jgi:hypothetical protein